MIYQSGAGSTPGGLLRMLLEEQNKSPILAQPGGDPASVMRQTVQGPIMTPESPGSERVVSIRPEGVTQQGPEAGQVVAPVSPVAPSIPAGAVVAPVAPQPIGTSIMPSGMPSSQPSQSASRSSAPVSQPSSQQSPSVLGASTKAAPLSTRITPNFQNPNYNSILDYNRKNFMTPQRSRSGTPTAKQNKVPTPTPTPRPGFRQSGRFI